MNIKAMEGTEQAIRTNSTERRHVYNGDLPHPVSDFMPLRNKPVRFRRRSPFGIISIVFLISILIVFYIWNKITVNRLVVEINKLENQLQKIEVANDLLKAEINRKSSLERIEKIALENLNLTYPKEQPVWFNLDTDKELKP